MIALQFAAKRLHRQVLVDDPCNTGLEHGLRCPVISPAVTAHLTKRIEQTTGQQRGDLPISHVQFLRQQCHTLSAVRLVGTLKSTVFGFFSDYFQFSLTFASEFADNSADSMRIKLNCETI